MTKPKDKDGVMKYQVNRHVGVFFFLFLTGLYFFSFKSQYLLIYLILLTLLIPRKLVVLDCFEAYGAVKEEDEVALGLGQ